jgi:hypothetical protein
MITVTCWMQFQVPLMILFCTVKLFGWYDLCADRLARIAFSLYFGFNLLSYCSLFLRVVEYRAAVLRSDVISLPVWGSGIVNAEQVFHQIAVLNSLWIEFHSECFCMTR